MNLLKVLSCGSSVRVKGILQSVPLATEPGISLIILPLMRILKRNLKRATDTHYSHTLQTHTTDVHYRHTLQTHTTDAHYRHTLQTHTTDTHYRNTLQPHTTDTHYRRTLQTRTTDTHYRHTLQTHSSQFLTQRTYSCSNFVAVSSLVLALLKKCRIR